MPQSKRKEYGSILKDSGIPDTYSLEWEVVTKEEEEVCDGGETWQNYTPDQPLPDPQNYGFTIGAFSKQPAAYIDAHKVTTMTSGYSTEKDIQFTAGIYMHAGIYGSWEKVTSQKVYLECGRCGRYLDTQVMLGMHYDLMDPECNGARYVIHSSTDVIPFYRWEFTPDDTPCKVVYQFELPDGLSYKEGSVVVRARDKIDIPNKDYHVQYSGNVLTVTVDDIKSLPYYFPFDKKSYDKDRYGYSKLYPLSRTFF